VTDLAEWDWIKFGDLPVTKQLIDKAGKAPKFTAKVAVEVDSIEAMCQLAKNGLGIAAVPRHLVKQDLHDGRLVVVPVALDLFSPGVFAVWPNNVSADSLVLRFVRFLAERLRGS
jgi:DNA-binding transcriptional LysR family regulator